MYKQRYPANAERITVVENGYDEETFSKIGMVEAIQQPIHVGAITLLHSGIVYPTERDPTQLFKALKRLSLANKIKPEMLKIRFRASVHEDLLNALAEQHGVAEYIDCQPPIPYRDALCEMLNADGLLVMQASNCNEQIPAKIYEYLRARRPILALTDPQGDTAATLRCAGISTIARLDSIKEIEDALLSFLAAITSGNSVQPNEDIVRQASREGRTAQLVQLLEAITPR